MKIKIFIAHGLCVLQHRLYVIHSDEDPYDPLYLTLMSPYDSRSPSTFTKKLHETYAVCKLRDSKKLVL